MFTLDNRLKNDTIELGTIDSNKVLLMNDANYPWIILVPMVNNVSEIFELEKAQQQQLNELTNNIAKSLKTEFKADKINIGALGNVVKQLHIHIIARFENDPTWPGPVWGQKPAVKYTPEQLESLVTKLQSLLKIN